MAWTAPMTFAANSVLTAAQMNTYLRDNMMETAPAKASTNGSYFVGAGPNAITERLPAGSTIATGETTTSTTYDDLATVGPSVTVVTGSKALVSIGAQMGISAGTFPDTHQSARMTIEITGATSVTAADDWAVGAIGGYDPTYRQIQSKVTLMENLTPGTNTFTCKYRVSGQTGLFQYRHLTVLPF